MTPRPETITLYRSGQYQTFPIGEGLERLAEGWVLLGSMLHKLALRRAGVEG